MEFQAVVGKERDREKGEGTRGGEEREGKENRRGENRGEKERREERLNQQDFGPYSQGLSPLPL